MKSLGVSVIFLLVCSTYLVCDGATSWFQHQYKSSWGLYMGVLRYARNEQDCIANCHRLFPDCSAASYRKTTWECHSTNDIRPIVQEMLPENTLLINIPRIKAWMPSEAYYPQQFPNYAYNDAVSRCQVFNGRLMNLTEFTDLYNAGQNMCDCAWLDGELMMYGSQTANNTECSVQVAGIGNCTETLAHAWCVPNY